MHGIYWAAAIVAAVVGLVAVVAWRAWNRDGSALAAFMMGLPLSVLVNTFVKTPLIRSIQRIAWPARTGPAPWGFLLSVLWVAPIAEEAGKLLPLALPRLRDSIVRPWSPLRYGMASGLGFGLGEALYLAWNIAQIQTYADMPFYHFMGYMNERLMVSLAHGVMTSVAMSGIARGGPASAYGYLGAVGLHALVNVGVMLQARIPGPLAPNLGMLVSAVVLAVVFDRLRSQAWEATPVPVQHVWEKRSAEAGNRSLDEKRWKDGALRRATVYGENLNGKVVSYDAGHSFYLDDTGNILISYNKGQTTAKAPLALNVSDTYRPGMEVYQTGFFISEDKTAIAYGGDDELIQVLISSDAGNTWRTYAVEGSTHMRTNKHIGFINKDEGWLVASPGSALGTSHNYVFETSDGGKTWTQIGNPNELYPRNTTGAGFSTKDIGFISFRVDDVPGPTIYWTQNRGKTWQRLAVTAPDGCKYCIPLSSVFFGANGIYPVECYHDRNEKSVVHCLISKDYGKTWQWRLD